MESIKIGMEFDKESIEQLDLIINKIKELNAELDKLNQRQSPIPFVPYPVPGGTGDYPNVYPWVISYCCQEAK